MFNGSALRFMIAVGSFVLGCFPGVMIGSASVFSQVDRFDGRYVLLREQSDDLKQAIDRATRPMSFLLRPIARRQLRQKTVLYPSFTMARSGEILSVNLPGEPVLSLPLSGSAVPWRAPDGETVRVHLASGSELVEVFEAKQGRCENHFALSPDHTVLTMDVRIVSHELPQAVEYRLVYRRA